jgi:RNA polymerase subunit RPABC4/transcription elongation factor Spt4
MEYTRNCPNCDIEIKYKNPRSFKWANRDNKVCRVCYTEKMKKTIIEKLNKGERWGAPRNKQKEHTLVKSHSRICPNCKEDIFYTRKDIRDMADKRKSVCNKCSSYIHKKNFNNVITEDHRKQMRASKAGFSSWEEYVEKYPKKQFYKREVWRLTYKNPLNTLPNWERRGRCGVDGAYQLDHIISINEGWEGGIPAEEIAKWENLRMIPWKENRNKW